MKTRFFSVALGLLGFALSGRAATIAPVPPVEAATVTIVATDPVAAESGPSTGLFTVSRTGPTTAPLTVFYQTSGSAVAPGDYAPLPGSIVIPAGSASAWILVTPVDDAIAENDETVVVTLVSPVQPLTPTPGTAVPVLYQIGKPGSATVTIKDNDLGVVALPTVNIRATVPNAVGSAKPGKITVSRIGDATGELIVSYMIVTDPIPWQASASSANPAASSPVVLIPAATPTVDYQALPGTITVPPGQKSAVIVIQPIGGQLVGAPKHVTLKVAASPSYNINQPDSASVILSNPVTLPTVSLVQPVEGANFTAPADITLSAEASETVDGIQKVDFLADGQVIGSVAGPLVGGVFTTVWKSVPAGSYTLQAKATDQKGESASSMTVHIVVAQSVSGTRLISAGSAWKYLDDGSDQGTAWQQPTFNDSKWASGPAPLGYGNGKQATVVGFGSDPKNKHITTYFRQAFEVKDVSAITSLLERVLRVDGAIAYLNGTEISHGNMPSGIIASTTLAATVLSGVAESTWHTATLDPKLLVNGNNVIAVEVHKGSVTNSDMTFDLELIANPVPGGAAQATLVIDSPKDGAAFAAPADIVINATAVDAKGYISQVEFYANDQQIGVSQLMFFQAPAPGTPIHHTLEWNGVPAGKYAITAKAKDSSGAAVISPPVTVTVAAARPLTNIPGRPENLVSGYRVMFQGDPGQRYSIQVSSDLQDWSEVGTVETTDGTIEFIDPAGGSLPLRFYRAVLAQ